MLAAPVARAAAPAMEVAVKAAYLTKLAPFVVWPSSALPGPGAPLTLCVQGNDPFDGLLDRLAAGVVVRHHPIIVRRMPRLAADSGCQIAYVGGSAQQSRADALKAVDGQPVLTVTDSSGDGDGRGIVHLVLIDGRVRLAIDAAKASQAGLSISSKLLALAAKVTK